MAITTQNWFILHKFGNEYQGTIQWELNNFENLWIENRKYYWVCSEKKRTFLAYKFNFYIKQNWVEFRIFIFDKDFQGFIQVELIIKGLLT